EVLRGEQRIGKLVHERSVAQQRICIVVDVSSYVDDRDVTVFVCIGVRTIIIINQCARCFIRGDERGQTVQEVLRGEQRIGKVLYKRGIAQQGITVGVDISC